MMTLQVHQTDLDLPLKFLLGVIKQEKHKVNKHIKKFFIRQNLSFRFFIFDTCKYPKYPLQAAFASIFI